MLEFLTSCRNMFCVILDKGDSYVSRYCRTSMRRRTGVGRRPGLSDAIGQHLLQRIAAKRSGRGCRPWLHDHQPQRATRMPRRAAVQCRHGRKGQCPRILWAPVRSGIALFGRGAVRGHSHIRAHHLHLPKDGLFLYQRRRAWVFPIAGIAAGLLTHRRWGEGARV